MKQCCLCENTYTGMGHNAKPVDDGRCCLDCNNSKVIPARIFRKESGFPAYKGAETITVTPETIAMMQALGIRFEQIEKPSC